ncbi:MAG: cell division protein ZapA [Burkholderiaceae bacterium]|nr:cell division protein ZapA [Burkholderiaceae bacterium]
MKQIEATILGQSYMLACPPDGETLLREAVAIVDREMSAIRDAGRVKARERIAVLTALNLAYQQAERGKATAPATAAAAPVVTAASASDAESPALAALIQRIDQALGEDGLLL